MADLPVRVTGRSLPWARDLALVAGASAGLAPLAIFGLGSFALSATVVGVVSGGLIGLGAPRLLDAVRGRLPLTVLATLGLGIGALWGAGIGAVAGAAEQTILGPSTTTWAAALIGAVQLGVFWFPYTFQTVLRGRTWPIVAATCGLAPLTGLAVFSLFI